MLRTPLRILLDARPGMKVVGECADGHDAVTAAQELQPDVVLMDLNMPNLNGIEATRQIRQRVRGVRVLVLSSYADYGQVREALRAGASGYVLKRSDIDELILAITTVCHGNTYFSASLAESMDVNQLIYESKRPESPTAREVLTAREREIVQLIAEGKTAREIASKLVISEKTVEGHKARAMGKIGAKNRIELLRFALKTGMVAMDAADQAG